MKYLVDANILSEPTKLTPAPRVMEWLGAHEPDMAVDPVILGELRFGILILPKAVVTRNRSDFADASVRIIDPFVAWRLAWARVHGHPNISR